MSNNRFMHKYHSLNPDVLAILQDKNTEPAFSGQFKEAVEEGSYLCRGCGAVLFRASNQFTSSCGWPSFDDEIPGAISRQADPDGRRTEILCAHCNGHLGHLFEGERLTDKNVRLCVNSLAIEFISNEGVTQTEEAIVAGGCFWGVEYLMKKLDGVLLTEVGYIGGELQYPTYEEVCQKSSGHLEALRIVFDPLKIAYSDIIKYFIEIHDFTQTDGQGADLGPQYLSAIFYFDQQQKDTCLKIIDTLKSQKYVVATQLYPVDTFWSAEGYHQDYYQKTGNQPYCHVWKSIFE